MNYPKVNAAAMAGLAALALFISACASAPPPTVQPSQPAAQAAPVAAAQPAPSKPEAPRPDREAARARELRENVKTQGFDKTSPKEFAGAEEDFALAEKSLGGDNALAKQKYDSASARYEQVLETGYASALKRRSEAAIKAKTDADAALAPVAAQETYAKAEENLRRAREAEHGKKYADALGLYGQAETNYGESRKIALERRKLAQEEMTRADSAVKSAGDRIQTIQQEIKEEVTDEKR